MLTALLLLGSVSLSSPTSLASGFADPPMWARPQTWWHWLNGNVTKVGITADLEAMKKVGIRGAHMFTVDQGIPVGPAKYAGPKWRELTAFAVKEAARLGMDLVIHNGAGWSSSGGPWITPANAMQVIAWSETRVQGPSHFSGPLPQPKAPQVESNVPFYRDIAVYAYPTPPEGDVVTPRPNDFLERTGVEHGDRLQPDLTPLASGGVIPSSKLLVLTGKLDNAGNLSMDIPDGDWTILRMGYVPTGVHNHPAPPEGDGLEVDKLSRAALDTHWAGLMAKVIKDSGPLAGSVLDGCLIDSYEVGTQNWTPKFREDFMARRGYDPLPYLPVIAGRTIDNKQKSERFLWDVRRTVADLFADNYYGYMAELCHKNGLKFYAEPYGNGGFDEIESGSKEDIPMAEFWLGGGAMETTKMVSSVGHTYGRPVVGAESFTGDDVRGRWLEEPYMMKTLGDQAFCNGINRYIFHRYAMQPWLDLKPGMTMGPWGTHFERTQTWWTEAATWLKYVERCQYLLQSGKFVADACYYYGQDSPNSLAYGGDLKPKLPDGYDYDGCDATTLLKMSVSNGRVRLPSGMSYRLLILPNEVFMTPKVITKIRDLVRAGAIVYGPKPKMSPSLQGYPACDETVTQIADEVWGPNPNTDSQGKTLRRKYGAGWIVWNEPLGELMNFIHNYPDFEYAPHNFGTKLIDIHRRIGNVDAYFVSNQNYRKTVANCTFRSSGRVPELWNAVTGKIEDAPAYSERGGRTSLTLNLLPAESVFVVFRKPMPLRHLRLLAPFIPKSGASTPSIQIVGARYESQDGRGEDVTDKVRSLVNEGQYEVPASNSLFGDPVVNVVKHLVVRYKLNGRDLTREAPENDTLTLVGEPSEIAKPKDYEVLGVSRRSIEMVPWVGETFAISDYSGTTRNVVVTTNTRSINLSRNWDVAFPPKLGAPPTAHFDNLISWPSSTVPGIKYFSGSAFYSKTITVPASFVGSGRHLRLDLGEVKNFATIKVNGRQVAVLWEPPYVADLTGYLKQGKNRLEIKVTNLWPNRLIGDEQYPPEADYRDGHLTKWPDWLLSGGPRPVPGRIAFATWHFYDKNSPLLESGMIGPVRLQSASAVTIRF